MVITELAALLTVLPAGLVAFYVWLLKSRKGSLPITNVECAYDKNKYGHILNYDKYCLYIHGIPTLIISGEFHYFRPIVLVVSITRAAYLGKFIEERSLILIGFILSTSASPLPEGSSQLSERSYFDDCDYDVPFHGGYWGGYKHKYPYFREHKLKKDDSFTHSHHHFKNIDRVL
ncbi:14698_t:CDS:2 [Dentiscutata heterogama]|uniref:14698_t:CDS:1 n=1 Tax=Dentiscutata heterogama TaxID=1316150 RepID=A0ACA9KF35_9GLOM|nr:14698_t:CDS:2 [Dentiscutata heterogama]